MNLFIAQMVSLISTYNDYIDTGNLPKNYLESDIFERCETVGFILIRNYVTRGHLNGDLVGANPIRWFKYLEKDDCQRLTLHFDTDRDKQNDSEKISPYINGTLYIEAVYKTYSNFWHCQWFDKPKPADKYVCDVRYYLPYRFEDTINRKIDFSAAAEHLKNVLNKCMLFTMDNDFLNWSQVCSMAIKVLQSTEPQSFFWGGVMNNERHPLNTRRVIYACLTAFMHPSESLWNINYKNEADKIKLATLRDEFYEALINGLVAAINSCI